MSQMRTKRRLKKAMSGESRAFKVGSGFKDEWMNHGSRSWKLGKRLQRKGRRKMARQVAKLRKY